MDSILDLVHKNYKLPSNSEAISYTNLTAYQKRLVFNWRNHEEIRKWMFNQKLICWNEHNSFIKSFKKREDKANWLIRYNKKYVGIISFSELSSTTEYLNPGYYVKPELIGSGFGNLLEYFIIFLGFNIFKREYLLGEYLINNTVAERVMQFFGYSDFQENRETSVVQAKLYQKTWEEKKKILEPLILQIFKG